MKNKLIWVICCFNIFIACDKKPLISIKNSTNHIELAVSEKDYNEIQHFYEKSEMLDEYISFQNFYCKEKFSIETNYKDTLVILN